MLDDVIEGSYYARAKNSVANINEILRLLNRRHLRNSTSKFPVKEEIPKTKQRVV